ncbi:MAG: hypothetical protein WC356_01710 [Candidatus Micrarchaeia archaeon]|jgi:hypothetical protein
MAIMVPDAVMDKNLDEVALSDRAFLCSQEPATYEEAATTYNLATIELTPASDWSKAAGDVSGRKLTLAEKTGTGAADGTANHVAFGLSSTSALKFVDTMTDFAVVAGVGFTLASKDVWEINAPAVV